MIGDDTKRAIDAIWRIESPRLIAGLARMVRDVGLAEEVAQDALVAALERWPHAGIPEKPGAWLMTTARNRAIDRLRRQWRFDGRRDDIAREIEALHSAAGPSEPEAGSDGVGDELLALVFTACHPVLPAEGRVALALRVLCGLTTGAIARAFLVPEATAAQRIVRAKRTLAAAGVGFAVPEAPERAARLGSVLAVIYLVFNEGYAATSGPDWSRPTLCHEALRLGRVLARLLPDEPEVHGLVALMEIQASRLAARMAHRCCCPTRTGPAGTGC